MITVPNSVPGPIVAPDEVARRAQSLRMRRFGMAVATYVVVILAAFLTTRLGLGQMTFAQWATFIGLALIGNIVFFVLFLTGANLRFSDPSLTRGQIVYSAFWGLVAIHSLPEARPMLLMFYLPAFSFGMLRLNRRQYLRVAACVMGLYGSLLVVEYLQNRGGFRIQYQIFLFVLFGILLTWFAFFGGFVSDIRRRLRLRNLEIEAAHERIKTESEERLRARIEKDNLIIQLEHALSEVKTLSGLIPICSACKRIRDDKGYWNQIESYIRDHSDAEFSHSICPDCQQRLYPDLY
ncbi:MAG: hypothetical protein HY913_23635 [Desulfomonile tiedjei]|nr:hypothetical protein [Desulfomonile tiedjei]